MYYEDRVTKQYIENALAGCGNCKIATGSYTGTGTFGQANPTGITFPFAPKFVFVCTRFGLYLRAANSNVVSENGFLWQNGMEQDLAGYGVFRYFSCSANVLQWYVTPISSDYTISVEQQLNKLNTVYYYLAIG